nr:MAG TPA: hypothetical protein [Caudoviricetes sp.]
MIQAIKMFLKNRTYACWVMVAMVFVATQVTKILIKHFTNKIENPNVRKKANLSIYFLPFIFATIVCLVYEAAAWHSLAGLSADYILGIGAKATAVYAGLEQGFKKVVAKAEEVTDDGELSKAEVKAVAKTAKDELADIRERLSSND